MLLILCILLSLLSCGLGLWAWTQRRALRAAAAQLAEQSRGDSDARVRLAVPNRSAEALLGSLPVWCGVYSLCHLMAMAIPSTAGWMAGYYLLSFFGQPILAALAGMWGSGQTAWLLQAIVMPASLLVPSFLPNWLTGEYLLWCWTIGMGWFILTTGLGLLWFRRREIK